MMSRIQCSYCGLPFNVRNAAPDRAYYCCSGCALASRLPKTGERGEFPVTPALIVALGAGFAFFNQVLFWSLEIALTHQKHMAQAMLFSRVSAGLGILVWGVLVAAVARAESRRWTDAAMAVATLAGLVVAALSMSSAGWEIAVNVALGLWLARGWGKRKFARNRSLTN
jgi:hypothetical protein